MSNPRPDSRKGKHNLATLEVRQNFAELLTSFLPTLKKDLAALQPRDRVKLLLELAKYVVPALQSVAVKEVNGDNDFEEYLKSMRGDE